MDDFVLGVGNVDYQRHVEISGCGPHGVAFVFGQATRNRRIIWGFGVATGTIAFCLCCSLWLIRAIWRGLGID